MPAAASSRLARAVTMQGFLPPISAMHGRGQGPDAMRCSSWVPTATEPVKVMPAVAGCDDRASPTSRPDPERYWNTPGGRPASRMQSASRRPAQGVSVAPLTTTVLPVTSAAAVGPPASASGKLKGAITTHAPYGRMTLRLRETTLRQRVVRQLVLVAAVLLEVVGVVPEEVDRLLRLAERLHPVLADLEGECRRNFVDARLP